MDADKRAAVCPTADAHGHGDAGRMAGRLFDVNAHDGICAVDILSAQGRRFPTESLRVFRRLDLFGWVPAADLRVSCENADSLELQQWTAVPHRL